MGLSRSPKPVAPFTEPPQVTILQLASDIFDMAASLGWNRYSILGYGLGGMVAMQLALLLDGRDDVECNGLVLMASAALAPQRGCLFTAGYPLVQSSLAERLNHVKDFVSKCLSQDWTVRHADKVDWMVKEWIALDHSLLIGEQQLIAMQDLNLTDQIGRIKTPTLILHGTLDGVVDVSYASMLHDLLQNSKFTPIENAGHWLHIMASNKLIHEINGFLA